MKKIAPQSIIGQQGVNLVERVTLEMSYAWRPTPIFDAGIDGEIEICDPVTHEATNAIVKVQIKSTTNPFQSETPNSFEYLCQQKDLDYWMRGNTPVILIVCRPADNEAYWISVKEYFGNPAVRKTRKVIFDKHRHRFDKAAANVLRDLAVPKDSGIYFSPLPKSELLYTNLLKVSSYSPSVFVAETTFRKPGEIWSFFQSIGAKAGPEWMMTNKRIVSFQNLESTPFNEVCELGTLERFDSKIWAESNDEETKRQFVRLLNQSLKEKTDLLDLRYHREQEYFYFPATKDFTTRRVHYQSLKKRVPREVFKKYGKKSDKTQIAYYRHAAFKGFFIRLDGEWYLEITPTYHFTSDGYNLDKFRESHLQGIKRLDRNPAVLGQLLMWSEFLCRPSLFHSEYPFLSFGDLATVEIDTGIADNEWYQAEDSDDAESINSEENQIDLLWS
ncbi:MAG: DUF4365 domain-containing protein [Acidobacteria bacterium]|nr:DUF4365 domain-containing protein [Acidobacteriota bacterium]